KCRGHWRDHRGQPLRNPSSWSGWQRPQHHHSCCDDFAGRWCHNPRTTRGRGPSHTATRSQHPRRGGRERTGLALDTQPRATWLYHLSLGQNCYSKPTDGPRPQQCPHTLSTPAARPDLRIIKGFRLVTTRLEPSRAIAKRWPSFACAEHDQQLEGESRSPVPLLFLGSNGVNSYETITCSQMFTNPALRPGLSR